MSIRIWLETTHHAAFRYGGWAYARQIDGAVSATAGGERSITSGRLELTGLIAALNGLAPGAAVSVRTSSPGLLAIGRLIVSPPAPEDAPTEDMDLWAQVLAAAKGRAMTFQAAPRAAQTPAAFLLAWAEVGQDKAKAAGRFSAAIPKSNLAKLNPA